jgi:hypothetical protein
MKTYASSRRLIVALAVTGILACPIGRLRAADQPPPKDDFNEYIFNNKGLVIKDGTLLRGHGKPVIEATLGNVVDALAELYNGHNFKFALSPGLDKIKIEDLKFVTGRPYLDLEAIRAASGDKFEWDERDSSGRLVRSSSDGRFGIDPATGLPLAQSPATSSDESSLFVLRPPEPTPETARTVEVFNLTPYFDRLTKRSKAEGTDNQLISPDRVEEEVHNVEGVITDTLAGFAEGSPGSVTLPNYAFHPGANLLVVIGTKQQLEVARKVVKALLNPADTGTADDVEAAVAAAIGGVVRGVGEVNRSDTAGTLKEVEELLKNVSNTLKPPRPGGLPPLPPASPTAPVAPAPPTAPVAPVPPAAPAPPR